MKKTTEPTVTCVQITATQCTGLDFHTMEIVPMYFYRKKLKERISVVGGGTHMSVIH
jgi:hypothetical protein